MANNRMYLQVKNKPDQQILLAKYYPSTGWHIFHDLATLNNWLHKFSQEIPPQTWENGQWGRVDLELVFETDSQDLDFIHKGLKNESI